jgi:hypothetical protein
LNYAALGILAIASVLNVLWGIALTVPCSVNKHANLSAPFLAVYGAGSVLLVLLLSQKSLGTSGASLGILLGDAFALALVLGIAMRIGGLRPSLWLQSTTESPAEVVRLWFADLKKRLHQLKRTAS